MQARLHFSWRDFEDLRAHTRAFSELDRSVNLLTRASATP